VNRAVGAPPGTLRRWQAAFLEQHAAEPGPDFLLVATPGAGKTLAACHVFRAVGAEQVILVCPTVALRAQWADAADAVGLHLDPRWPQRGRWLAFGHRRCRRHISTGCFGA